MKYLPYVGYVDPSVNGFSQIPFPALSTPSQAKKFLLNPQPEIRSYMDDTKILSVVRDNGTLFGFAFYGGDWMTCLEETPLQALEGHYPFLSFDLSSVIFQHSFHVDTLIESYSELGALGFDPDWPAIYEKADAQAFLELVSWVKIDRALIAQCLWPSVQKVLRSQRTLASNVKIFTSAYEAWMMKRNKDDLRYAIDSLRDVKRPEALNILKSFLRVLHLNAASGSVYDVMMTIPEYGALVTMPKIRKIIRPVDYAFGLIQFDKFQRNR